MFVLYPYVWFLFCLAYQIAPTHGWRATAARYNWRACVFHWTHRCDSRRAVAVTPLPIAGKSVSGRTGPRTRRDALLVERHRQRSSWRFRSLENNDRFGARMCMRVSGAEIRSASIFGSPRNIAEMPCVCVQKYVPLASISWQSFCHSFSTACAVQEKMITSTDLWSVIWSFLGLRDRLRASSVNRLLRQVSLRPNAWQAHGVCIRSPLSKHLTHRVLNQVFARWRLTDLRLVDCDRLSQPGLLCSVMLVRVARRGCCIVFAPCVPSLGRLSVAKVSPETDAARLARPDALASGAAVAAHAAH